MTKTMRWTLALILFVFVLVVAGYADQFRIERERLRVERRSRIEVPCLVITTLHVNGIGTMTTLKDDRGTIINLRGFIGKPLESIRIPLTSFPDSYERPDLEKEPYGH